MPDTAPLTVRQLRAHWKPTKERLTEQPEHEPTLIRIHRACSWLQRLEELGENDLDERLVFQWIALNSLYGQWDPEQREPRPDGQMSSRFFKRILELDEKQRIASLLTDHRRLVMTILENSYLSSFFWEEPSQERARQTLSTRHKAATWYLEKRWALILERVLERIYLLRCQLVHGAATCRGRLNRTALNRCSMMLGHLLPAVLLIMMDHGAEADWGPLCYPPNPC